MTPVAIVALSVGQVRTLSADNPGDARDVLWTSAIFKQPVAGAVLATSLGLAGDAQADPRFHGGIDKAVLVYSADHYPLWQAELGLSEMQPGGFGENITVAGQAESDVCLGDIWQTKTAGAVPVRLQVSQPRQPCWKLARRWGMPELPKHVVRTGRGGWYCRVIAEGELAAGQTLTLQDRPRPSWTISRANQIMYGKPFDAAAARELAALPELSQSWRETLCEKANQ